MEFQTGSQHVHNAQAYFDVLAEKKSLKVLEWNCVVFDHIEAVQQHIPHIETIRLSNYDDGFDYNDREENGGEEYLDAFVERLLPKLKEIFPNADIFLENELQY